MKRAPPVLTCVFPNCGRKANNLCPNSLCLAHCHEQMETKGFQMCKRHEREWDNKTKSGGSSSRRRDAASSAASAPASSSGAGTSASASSSAAAIGVLKKARREGLEHDGFGLLEAAPTPTARACPGCEKLVADADSFFLLHVASCDASALAREASRLLAPKSSSSSSSSAANQRRARAESVLASVLDEKPDEEEQEADDEAAMAQATQRAALLRELAASAERAREVLERPRAPTEEGTPEAAPWTGATLARLARKADFVPLGPSASFIKLT